MANNPYVNRVELDGGTVLIDISQDTVTANTLLSGYTSHDHTGAPVSGAVSFVDYYTGTSDPASSLGNNGDIYLKTVS